MSTKPLYSLQRSTHTLPINRVPKDFKPASKRAKYRRNSRCSNLQKYPRERAGYILPVQNNMLYDTFGTRLDAWRSQ
ncbi:hypothetical protein SCLCIDRAFT_330193 [Scleroderma citrinum Foug A]|uniref:Uncharacterized protein n=1 Tax=Scleroderma citrinum Foug A TaxID=1036808 RepID=A0A0C3E1B1_9AGAM|nr:hypothetical protein SCLCIDRAFT_330193 [Scleroderma citrinum Foug A]